MTKTEAQRPEAWPAPAYRDDRGAWCCGEDFMAGTICSMPPDHPGGHAPICQHCGGDWYLRTCTCLTWCSDCGAGFEHDGQLLCEDCRPAPEAGHDDAASAPDDQQAMPPRRHGR